MQYSFVYYDWRLEGLRIVLQYNSCIVTKGWLEIVSRYKICIVTKAAVWLLEEVCRDTLECIVIEAEGHKAGPCRETGHDTVSQARGRACDTAACALRHGAEGCDTAKGHGHDTAVAACNAAMCARLGVLLGQQVVNSACFDPVLIQYCSGVNFWTLFMNPVHEHYSSQFFFQKKIK